MPAFLLKWSCLKTVPFLDWVLVGSKDGFLLCDPICVTVLSFCDIYACKSLKSYFSLFLSPCSSVLVGTHFPITNMFFFFRIWGKWGSFCCETLDFGPSSRQDVEQEELVLLPILKLLMSLVTVLVHYCSTPDLTASQAGWEGTCLCVKSTETSSFLPCSVVQSTLDNSHVENPPSKLPVGDASYFSCNYCIYSFWYFTVGLVLSLAVWGNSVQTIVKWKHQNGRTRKEWLVGIVRQHTKSCILALFSGGQGYCLQGPWSSEAPLWCVVATGNIAKLTGRWECESVWDLLLHCLLSVVATEMFWLKTWLLH